LGKFLVGLGTENVVKFYYYLHILWILGIIRIFGIFYGHLVYFAIICYFFPVLVCCTKKNLATLLTANDSGETFQIHLNLFSCGKTRVCTYPRSGKKVGKSIVIIFMAAAKKKLILGPFFRLILFVLTFQRFGKIFFSLEPIL
jgi:hypothetical protein